MSAPEWEPGIWHSRDTRCPVCEKPINAHALHTGDPGQAPPAHGDFTVCFGCAAPLRFEGSPFGTSGHLRALRPGEVDELMSSEYGPEALLAARQFIQQFGKYEPQKGGGE